ncbi:hypothetical protein NMY22_g1132 [Coprinellus aureogranulatus]|nr:hypothetical protein NMY22_g1132 [Coprinellus aureogranulatus]
MCRSPPRRVRTPASLWAHNCLLKPSHQDLLNTVKYPITTVVKNTVVVLTVVNTLRDELEDEVHAETAPTKRHIPIMTCYRFDPCTLAFLQSAYYDEKNSTAITTGYTKELADLGGEQMMDAIGEEWMTSLQR